MAATEAAVDAYDGIVDTGREVGSGSRKGKVAEGREHFDRVGHFHREWQEGPAITLVDVAGS